MIMILNGLELGNVLKWLQSFVFGLRVENGMYDIMELYSKYGIWNWNEEEFNEHGSKWFKM